MSKIISKYLSEISEIPSDSTELSFRAPLQNLLNSLAITDEVTQTKKQKMLALQSLKTL